jgi:hypothetical protein
MRFFERRSENCSLLHWSPGAQIAQTRQMSAATAGVIVGTLKEQHADCIVLSDGIRIPLAVRLTLEPCPPGAAVTVIYSRNSDGQVVVQRMKCSTALARVASGISYGGLRA